MTPQQGIGSSLADPANNAHRKRYPFQERPFGRACKSGGQIPRRSDSKERKMIYDHYLLNVMWLLLKH